MAVNTTYPPLEITLFGSMNVHIAGCPMRRLRSRTASRLLALLVLRGSVQVDRSWAAGLIWPESSDGHALRNLRQSLTDIRDALGSEAWRVQSPTPRSLRLNMADAEVDVLHFDAAVADGSPEALTRAVHLYRGPLMEDCFDDWALPERMRRETEYLGALEFLARCASDARRHGEAIGRLRQLTATDPLRESAWRMLMREMVDDGDRAGALETYRELRTYLHEHESAEPDPETTALYREIRGSAAKSPARPISDVRAAPAPAAAVKHLPVPMDSLVGRATDVDEVRAHLSDQRLVVLTGTGGVGKSRLAIAAAHASAGSARDGAWFVDLSAVIDGDLVPMAVASALALPGRGDALDRLRTGLQARDLLLVLDNCEQVLPSCERLVTVLLPWCSRLRVLATSRHSLRVPGATVYRVQPLPFPSADEDAASTCEEMLAFAAVQLFVERAQQAYPPFPPTQENVRCIASICRRLDGIPLAIELAAARVRAMSVLQISDRLDDRFRLLAAASPTLPPRHATMRAVLDWSYAMLPEDERVLLHRLVSFAGGCSLEAAEEVCARRGALRSDVDDLITSLVDRSLVTYRDGAAPPRFRLLETVRQYVSERLAEGHHVDDARDDHLDWCVRTAEEAERRLLGTGDGQARAAFAAETDNFRAALDYALAAPERAGTALRLASALGRFWWLGGHVREGYDLLLKALAGVRDSSCDAGLHARAKVMAGMLGVYCVEPSSARSLLDEGLRESRAVGDSGTAIWALMHLGIEAWYRGDYVGATPWLEQCLAAAREAEDLPGSASALQVLAATYAALGKYEAGTEAVNEALVIQRTIGRQTGLAWAQYWAGNLLFCRGALPEASAALRDAMDTMGPDGHGDLVSSALAMLAIIHLTQGEVGEAQCCADRSLSLARTTGLVLNEVFALCVMARVEHVRGEPGPAHAHLSRAIGLAHGMGNRSLILHPVHGLAALASQFGDHERAARYWGAADAIREATGTVPSGPDMAFLHAARMLSETALPRARFAELAALGGALGADELATDCARPLDL